MCVGHDSSDAPPMLSTFLKTLRRKSFKKTKLVHRSLSLTSDESELMNELDVRANWDCCNRAAAFSASRSFCLQSE